MERTRWKKSDIDTTVTVNVVKLGTLPTVDTSRKVRVRVWRVMDAGFSVFTMTYTGLPYTIVQGSPARIWESKPRSDRTNIKKVKFADELEWSDHGSDRGNTSRHCRVAAMCADCNNSVTRRRTREFYASYCRY